MYIGETGRQFSIRQKEHKDEVDSVNNRPYTRSNRKQSESTVHKSAITDHTAQYNHTMNWDKARILDREGHRLTRWIREAIHIRKRRNNTMNRDDGQYNLPQVYNPILHAENATHQHLKQSV